MPQNTPMKRQFTTIDGRTVMSNLPQHWGGDDWTITGVDNPLPVGNYVQTEAGVWIPQKGSDDGAADVRLTGSIVEQVERRKQVILRERGVRNTTISFSTISVPSGAIGAIFILDIHGVTGTFDSGEGICITIRFQNWYGGTLTTEITNRRTLQYAIFYPNAYRGDYEKYISDGDIKISQLPLVSRLSYAIPITGTFEVGEGFDCTVMVEWLF